MHKTLRETVLEYADKGHRYTVQVHTFDGVDRTFQSSGAGDEPISSHDQARLTLDDLMGKVQAANLPLQWLLDTAIIVQTYDRVTCKATTSHWVVVFVPMFANNLTNARTTGFHVVFLSEQYVLYPDAQALHIEIGTL